MLTIPMMARLILRRLRCVGLLVTRFLTPV